MGSHGFVGRARDTNCWLYPNGTGSIESPLPAQTLAPVLSTTNAPTLESPVKPLTTPEEAIVDWPMFRSNSQHAVAPVPFSGGGEWVFSTQGMVISSPIFSNGAVYFTSMDGNLYKLDVASGEQLWLAEVGKDAITTPAIVDNVVYAGGGKGLFAIDAQTGKPKWSFDVEKGVKSSPAVYAGKVYFGGIDGKVYALDAANGEKAWEFSANAEVGSSPAVVDGKVYIGSADNNLYILFADTGKLDWSYKAVGRNPEFASSSRQYAHVCRYGRQFLHCRPDQPTVEIRHTRPKGSGGHGNGFFAGAGG